MPLQHINVSPVTDCDKEIEAALSVPQMYIRGTKSEEGLRRSESGSSGGGSSSGCLEICRICHCEGEPGGGAPPGGAGGGGAEGGLIAPCYCSGSLRFVHQTCLQQWIKSSNIKCCELCKFEFIMQTRTKPFMEWEPLEMTGFERRKLLCAVIFHAIALTCVVWSLYVLISRTAEEIQDGLLEWPFWTKLIVVAIGFTGGVVFMYIQCKAYVQICQRWKAFNRWAPSSLAVLLVLLASAFDIKMPFSSLNEYTFTQPVKTRTTLRVIYVQNAPEKEALSVEVPIGSSGGGGGGGPALGRPRLSAPPLPLHPSSFPPLAPSSTTESNNPNNYKDETSIDLKGVRNLHIFFNDESRVCVQNEDRESEESEGAPDTSWRIKIGKAESLPSQRNTDSEGKAGSDSEDCPPSSSKPSEQQPAKQNNDSVVKLQIKKAEIVIKFGGEGNGGEEKLPSAGDHRKDNTSVNIKIDDKERGEPIVIDVVKKKPPIAVVPPLAAPTAPAATAGENKDPVQIRFDFGPEESDEARAAGEDCPPDSKLLQVGRSYRCPSDPGSESDSSSHSPLLSTKNNSFIKNV